VPYAAVLGTPYGEERVPFHGDFFKKSLNLEGKFSIIPNKMTNDIEYRNGKGGDLWYL
jgi:hypothetical protein